MTEERDASRRELMQEVLLLEVTRVMGLGVSFSNRGKGQGCLEEWQTKKL